MSFSVRKRAPRAAVIAVIAALACAGGAARAGAAPRVQAGETVGELLDREDPAREAGGPSSGSETVAAVLRLTAAIAALAAAGGLLVWLRRRFGLASATRRSSGLVAVVGRAALSPRHGVYLLRVGTQRIVVVGVCGERMTVLAEIERPEDVRELLEATGADPQLASEATGRTHEAGESSPGARRAPALRHFLGRWRPRVSAASAGGDGCAA